MSAYDNAVNDARFYLENGIQFDAESLVMRNPSLTLKQAELAKAQAEATIVAEKQTAPQSDTSLPNAPASRVIQNGGHTGPEATTDSAAAEFDKKFTDPAPQPSQPHNPSWDEETFNEHVEDAKKEYFQALRQIEPDTLYYLQRLFEPEDWIDLQFIHQTETWTDEHHGKHARVDDNFMTLEQALKSERMVEQIQAAQDKGWNVYVGMNAFTPGVRRRRKKDVKDVRSIYIEFDENGDAGLEAINCDDRVPEPHFILQSSPGKYYVIWLVEGFTVEQQEALNSALQKRFDSDPASVDAARVLRLPGTRNLKPKYSPTPTVQIIEEGSTYHRYSMADFEIEINAKEQRPTIAIASEKLARLVDLIITNLDDAQLGHGDPEAYDEGFKIELDECLWGTGHQNGKPGGAAVFIDGSGRLGYHCFHTYCAENRHWKEFRDELEKRVGHKLSFSDSNLVLAGIVDERSAAQSVPAESLLQEVPLLSVPEGEQPSEEDWEDYSQLLKECDPKYVQEFLDQLGSESKAGAELLEKIRILLFAPPKEIKHLALNRQEALNIVDKLVYDDLKSKGQFFNVGGLGYLVLKGEEAKPIKISHTDSRCLNLLQRYHLHPGRNSTNVVGQFLGVRSSLDGFRTEMHISFHYHPGENTAYYAEASGYLLKVTKDGISRIKNGEDKVLFTYPDNYQPWTMQPEPTIGRSLIPERGSALYDAVFNGIKFEDSLMSDEQKYILLTVYLILLFLPGLNKTKIILQMIGPSGSGKSFFLEVLGRLLIGPKFSTQPMTEDKQQFENQVINSSYIAYDNVNYISKPIMDLLCQVATGLKVERRELYTTAGKFEAPALATVAISSITPQLTEVEHANRSLMLKVQKRQEFKSSVDLFADLDARRNELMTEIVARVRMVLTALDAQRTYRPPVKMRLADIATFILRVARHEGWEGEANDLLAAWSGEQMDEALKDDDISHLMIRVLQKQDSKPEWLSSSDFLRLLERELGFGARSGDWGKSARAFSAALMKNEPAYRMRYGLEVRNNPHTKNREFRLNPSADLLERIRSLKPAPVPSPQSVSF